MNSRCEQIQSQFDAWIDEELTAIDRADITAHLSGCRECSALFQRLSGVDGDLAALSTAADRIATAPRNRRVRPMATLLRIAAAIALLAAAGLAIRTALHRPEAPPHIIQPAIVASESNPVPTIIASTPALAVSLPTRNPRVSIVMLYEPVRLPSASPAQSKPSL